MGNSSGGHLLLVSLGPVQDFIATARRTRDLWFGSWVLSEVSKAAARRLAGSGARLVFPALGAEDPRLEPGSGFNVSNVVFAETPGEPAGHAGAALEAARHRLLELWREARGRFDGAIEATAEAQIADLLETAWAAVPSSGHFGADREAVYALLAARKNTRDFAASSWGGSVPKSSLDGARESVIPEGAYPSPGAGRDERARQLRELRGRYGARGAERLSGVDLLKRHGGRAGEARFFSTSHVAALPVVSRLRDPHVPALREYTGVLERLGVERGNVPNVVNRVFDRLDGHVLFEERLADDLEGQALEEARRALAAFFKATGLPRPSPYYGLLVADGDRMGAAISRLGSADAQRELSERLAGFAEAARGIVEQKHGGELVYAGGDDVLAFLPLHAALGAARELALAFARALAGYPDEEGQPPTLSAGLAVCHHLEPLQDALALARAAEGAAKGLPGKNALAVTLAKRGGADVTVVGRFSGLEARLRRFAGLHLTEALPDGAAYELADLARRLEGPGLAAALQAEAARVLSRKVAGGGPLADAVRLELRDALEANSVGETADELVVARLFADAAERAGLKEPQ